MSFFSSLFVFPFSKWGDCHVHICIGYLLCQPCSFLLHSVCYVWICNQCLDCTFVMAVVCKMLLIIVYIIVWFFVEDLITIDLHNPQRCLDIIVYQRYVNTRSHTEETIWPLFWFRKGTFACKPRSFIFSCDVHQELTKAKKGKSEDKHQKMMAVNKRKCCASPHVASIVSWTRNSMN